MSESTRSFDQQAALERVGGDDELLREIAGIYRDTYEDMVHRVRDAVAAGDPQAVKSAAHFAKGTVANFGAESATEAARRLEQMGAEAQLDGAAELADELADHAARLAAELAAYAGGE